jgi:hypothetical protein
MSMSFSAHDHGRVASGEITVSFRLWKYAHVKAGKTYRSGFGGQLEVLAVDLMPAALVSQSDVRLTGCTDVAHVWRLAGEHTGTSVTPDTLLYRVEFRYLPAGPSQDEADADIPAILAKLRRMDALSRHGPWTMETLRLIERHPGMRARDLATMAGREELAPFKADVRKLKYLSLTRSLEIGYELTDLGRRLLANAL